MKWQDIREQYPDRWLVIEAIKAHSVGGKRVLDEIAVVNSSADARNALAEYLRLHRQTPDRELLVVHTNAEILDVTERKWLGIRGIQ